MLTLYYSSLLVSALLAPVFPCRPDLVLVSDKSICLIELANYSILDCLIMPDAIAQVANVCH